MAIGPSVKVWAEKSKSFCVAFRITHKVGRFKMYVVRDLSPFLPSPSCHFRRRMFPACLPEWTAPSGTMSRQKDASMGDGSSACPLQQKRCPPSHEIKVKVMIHPNKKLKNRLWEICRTVKLWSEVPSSLNWTLFGLPKEYLMILLKFKTSHLCRQPRNV